VAVKGLSGSARRLGFAAAAEAALRQLNLDIVHDMGDGWFADLIMPHGGARAASFEQNLLLSPAWLRPIKRLAAGLLPRYRAFRKLERRQYLLNGSRLFLAVSEMVKRDMMRRLYVPEPLIRVIYNGVDTERFTPQNRRLYRDRVRNSLGLAEQVILLTVAQNFRLKGVAETIRTLAELRRRGHDAAYVVVGGGRKGPFERLATRLGCNEHVRFVGPCSEPERYYAAADIYVQPTYYDPCSLVVLEALACGLPVVTSSYNGAAELLEAGRHGYVVADPADVASLTMRLEQLMDPEHRRECSVRARELAEANTLQENYGRILSLYEQVHSARR
jgi:UDP-glucose:(heptosyl)LPS alpha-1,3-glucosyltransferase